MVDKKSDATTRKEFGADSLKAVVSSPSSGKRPGKRAILVMALVLVVLAVGGLAWYFNSRQSSTQTPVAVEKRKTVLKDVAQVNQDRNYAEEAKLLQAYIDSNPPAELAGQEIVRLGVAYTNAKDYDNAIKTYQIALDKYPDSEYAATRALGIVYMQRGEEGGGNADYQKARGYFDRALELAKADPEKRAMVPADESNIRYLESKQR